VSSKKSEKKRSLISALDHSDVQAWMRRSSTLKEALGRGYVESIRLDGDLSGIIVLNSEAADWVRSAIALDLEPIVEVF
jgi:hypothetical protein